MIFRLHVTTGEYDLSSRHILKSFAVKTKQKCIVIRSQQLSEVDIVALPFMNH